MAWGWLKDRLSDVAEATWEAVTEVADTAADTVGSAAAATGDVIGVVGEVVDTATLGVASEVLHAVDNTVLDAVDAATGGLINIDYDDGNISASVGVDGVLHVGAAVGEDGVRQSSDVLDQRFDLGLTDDGLEVSGQGGIDWGPLPYAEGDLDVAANGDVTFEGRVQGTLPTPVGLLSGRAEGEFVREGDQWGGHLDADGTLHLPDGSIVGGGVDAAYLDTADGSFLSVGVEGSYTRPGVGTVGGSVGYERIEADGMVAEQFDATGYAAGYGGRVEAGVHYTGVTSPDGSTGSWDAHVDVDVPVLGDVFGGAPTADAPVDVAAPEPAAVIEPADEFDHAIAAADDVEASVDEMFGDLG